MKSAIKRRTFMVNGTLGVLLTGGVGLAYLSLGDDGGDGSASASRTVAVARGDLVSSVSAAGSIASARSRSLNFTATGTVAKIYVRAGQKVRKGQKLARLDQTEAQENVNATRAAYNAAAEGDLTKAQDYASYVQARNAYNGALRTIDATVLHAPFAGTVTAVNGTVGQSPSSGSTASTGTSAGTTASTTAAGSGFIDLADLSKVEVEGDFTEADTTKIKVGQAATVTFDALTGITAAGRVTGISSVPTTTNNVVSYTATIALKSRPGQVRLGQTATVAVTVSRASNALYVPAAAVTTAGGQSTVTVLRDGAPVVQVVQIGVSGDLGTEIKSGLEEGEEVRIAVAASSGTGNTRNFPGGGQGIGGGIPGGAGAPRGGGGGR
ncbi:MAG: efflux RND transporter periplasmic adaptor subunit [Streptosporangiaceae bacterium]